MSYIEWYPLDVNKNKIFPGDFEEYRTMEDIDIYIVIQ